MAIPKIKLRGCPICHFILGERVIFNHYCRDCLENHDLFFTWLRFKTFKNLYVFLSVPALAGGVSFFARDSWLGIVGMATSVIALSILYFSCKKIQWHEYAGDKEAMRERLFLLKLKG